MNVEALTQKLSNKLNLPEMKRLGLLTSEKEISISDLFSLCLHTNHQIAFRASWILEYVAITYKSIFAEIIPQFLKAYPLVKNLSVKRHFTKIMMILCKDNMLDDNNFKSGLHEKCLTATFDWLLDPKTPLAVQCNTLDLVYNFSKQEDWISYELKVILEKNLITNSPALISRSKRILKRLNSEETKFKK